MQLIDYLPEENQVLREQLGQRRLRFNWLFEIKYDGFRALAHIGHGRCKLVSRNGNEFKSFRTLSESLATELKRSVVHDGEIVCLDGDGKSRSTISCSGGASLVSSPSTC